MTDVFPSAPLDVRFELHYGGTWNDITPYVRMQDDLVAAVITHGSADEATRPDPAACTFMINNVDGRFSPRNPRSPLYGLIGRNTLFRVRIVHTQTYTRFCGEISQWPVAWEPSGADIWVTVTASGISRRLGQQSSPVMSPLRREQPTVAGLVAYWPMEDPGTAHFGSAVSSAPPMALRSGSSTLATSTRIPGASALPEIGTGWWHGALPDYSPSAETQLRWVQWTPTSLAADSTLLVLTGTGKVRTWALVLKAATDDLELRGYDGGGVRVLTETLFGGLTPVGRAVRMSIDLTQNGADVDWEVWVMDFEDADGLGLGSGWIGTLAGHTVGRITAVRIGDPTSGGLGDTVVGHVTVSTQVAGLFALKEAARAYRRERAEVRARRLCDENGVQVSTITASTSTPAVQMGDQPAASLTELLAECADLGVLIFDAREYFGLTVLPFEYRQDFVVAVNTSYGRLVPPLEVIEDDQGLVNDVTVTRSGGSSARHRVDSGPLSVQDAPDGVGSYDIDVTLNLSRDNHAQSWAQWLASLGTWDEARYPVVRFNLLRDEAGDLLDAVASAEVGQVIRISDPPDFLPGGPLELMIKGYTEQLGPWCWKVDFNCGPAARWRTWIVEDPNRGHINTAGSATVGSFTAGAGTTLTVSTTTGPRWVTPADQADAFPFDIEVSGVVLRVTSVSGTSSPQIFTVEAAPLNGVAKTIPAGSAVAVHRPARVAV